MCEVLESINTSIKGYLARTILKMYWRNITQWTPWTTQCCIINSISNGSINLNGRLNVNTIPKVLIILLLYFDLTVMRGEDWLCTIFHVYGRNCKIYCTTSNIASHDRIICEMKIIVQ